MKKWRAQIRVCDNQIGTDKALGGEEYEHILDRANCPDSWWDTINDKEPSTFGGYWYKVEVTSDEIGVEDDGNIAS